MPRFASPKFRRALFTTAIIGCLPMTFCFVTIGLGNLSGPSGRGATLGEIAGIFLVMENIASLAVLPFLAIALIRASSGDFDPVERWVLALAAIFFAVGALALLSISLLGSL